ncbi:autotransporter outer membrane beta-barrel domain-containing protein [Chryseobacterium elymi]|uniref:hypothetical protein n=1 Tax=Chryseobacterium elymi TaxID=395936 RepID=UPI000F4D5498|nr:hypothetical protein [Chryseobacterium elymi]
MIGATMAAAQVGINTETPKATLDVTAKTTDATTAEGIIAPRLTGDQIKGKDAQYIAAQTGSIVYATSASSDAGVAATKTINIDRAGYYYFDGTVWQNVNGNDWKITGNNNINADIHFLGTTNDVDLVFRRNDIQAGWVSPAGVQNTAFGTLALPRATVTTGNFNGAIGYAALGKLTTGQRNQAMGNYTLGELTTGLSNVGIGNGAGRTITTASHNTAIGERALEGGSSAALQNGNTAIGKEALRYSSGSNNVALGYFAARGTDNNTLITGSNNIAIGANQTLANFGTSNQLNIGGAIFGTGLTGSVTAPAGNIGIGTAAPANPLHIVGPGGVSAVRIQNNPTTARYLEMGASDNNVYIDFKNGTNFSSNLAYDVANDRLLINSHNSGHAAQVAINSNGGNLGIGTNVPNSKVQVKGGDVYVEDIGSGIILRSPNGQCRRVTVSNLGAMVVSAAIACP